MSDKEYMVTQKEAADFLNVSTKSISRYRKRGLPYKLILNPVTGKQEVRFHYADLERWDEGRQLLATYARDGETTAAGDEKSNSGRQMQGIPHDSFLNDLLIAYKEQIELLRDQMEDMREQLARRDRQIDDLMRLMVGLQLEYKPMPVSVQTEDRLAERQPQRVEKIREQEQIMDLYEAVELPPRFMAAGSPVLTVSKERAATPQATEKKKFSPGQISASILRLRGKGKSYEEIAHGLNQINVATLSGHAQWTAHEVQALLPALVDGSPRTLGEEQYP
jgi:hypothetical protein